MIAALLTMSLGTALTVQTPVTEPTPVATPEPTPNSASAAAPEPTPIVEPAPPPVIVPPPKRRFVFGFLTGITFGLSPVPSLDLAFFFGGRLRQRPWTLGYQFTFSSGIADRYAGTFFTHRHHLTAMRNFGKRDRGFTSVGGGAAFLAIDLVVEAEARLGYRLGKRKRGIVAAQARLGWNIAYREQAPVPMLGVVIGGSML